MNAKLLRAAILLGLLSLIGPFAIDMYLPTLPAIGTALKADTAAVQASIMSFMIAVAVGTLIYGPVSDMIGRKPPLYFGIVLYTIGAIGCALSQSIEMLIIFRFVQGVGACASFALPRAIVRDNYTGAEATQLFSLVMLVFSISPILAPSVGSLVNQFGSWREIFWVMTIAGVLTLVLCIVALKETRPKEARVESGLGSAMSAYWVLIRDGRFLGLTLIGGFGISSFMAFIGSSSFVYINHYGLSPTLYSLAFSVNAIGFFAASQATGFLVKRFGLNRVVRYAVWGFTGAMMLLLALFLAGFDGIPVLSSLMFIAFAFLGLVLPTTGVLAMEEHGAIAGTASALLGTLQTVAGAVVMGIVAAFFNGTAMPMVVGFAVCALIVFVLTQLTIRGDDDAVVAEPAEGFSMH
ncbi:MAG TPA: multidrug effflux MFS transporter [Devosiaceae bacterium]|nr:multidrug effflux MFS transporter [Devosiaceae bacterium]